MSHTTPFVNQGLSYFPDDRPDLRDMLCRWTPAFSKSLMCHLRKDDSYSEALKARGPLLFARRTAETAPPHCFLFTSFCVSTPASASWVDGRPMARLAFSSNSSPPAPPPAPFVLPFRRTSCCPTSWTRS